MSSLGEAALPGEAGPNDLDAAGEVALDPAWIRRRPDDRAEVSSAYQ